jgi:cell division protein FtsI (penicillin-binding protein 3)
MVLSLKLIQVQIIGDKRLDQKIESQFASRIVVRARRGDILDRQGRVIATSVIAPSAFIDPKIEKLSSYKIRKLARTVGLDYETLRKKIRKNTRFVWLKRKLDEGTYERLKKLNYKGLSFIDEYKRVYPYKDSLGFLVGNVDVDGKGISGLELEYDETLAGKAIKKKALRDGKGRLVLFSDYEVYNELKGKNVETAIDIDLQLFLTQSLKNQLKAVDAKRAWASTMDLNTGEVIAQSQVSRSGESIKKNIMTSELHEPGSVLKTFSFLKAIEELDLSPSDEVNCHNKGFKIGRRLIRNSHKEDCETTSLVRAFSRSLNTVSAELSLKVGEDELLAHYKKLGFNKKTGIDFPGEAKPIFYNELSGKHQLASLSFGHGVALNSMQLMKAYASLFNSNTNLKPTYKLQKEDYFDAVNMKTAFLTKGLLASVVSDEGTAPKAKVNHYLVGGKTGTAQKPDLENGGYSKEVLSTFIGVYPLTKPRFITLVSMDEPQEARSGGVVSAPVFSEVASFLLRKEQIVPDKLDLANINEVKSLLKTVKKIHKEPYIEGTVPDLKGLSLREAMAIANKHKIKMNIDGNGKVYDMTPDPGKLLPEDRKITLALRPY